MRLRLQARIDRATVKPEDRADLDIVHDQISLRAPRTAVHPELPSQSHHYVELVGNALYTPFILEYTIYATSTSSRASGSPQTYVQARQNLANAPEIWTK
jgi:hypothetical protein